MSDDVTLRLREVFGAVLGCDPDRLTDTDSPKTVKGWDSVNHMQLLLAIEEAFGAQFQPEEFATLTSFGLLRAKLAGDAVGGAAS